MCRGKKNHKHAQYLRKLGVVHVTDWNKDGEIEANEAGEVGSGETKECREMIIPSQLPAKLQSVSFDG